MTPDAAAQLLQIPERGVELLERFNEEENIKNAIQAVQAGFKPQDVAVMYDLPFRDTLPTDEDMPPEEGAAIHVYECTTARCRQRGRVATSSVGPDYDRDDPEDANLPICPSCRELMKYVTSVSDEIDISHMKRTYLPRAAIKDPLSRTDKWTASYDVPEEDE